MPRGSVLGERRENKGASSRGVLACYPSQMMTQGHINNVSSADFTRSVEYSSEPAPIAVFKDKSERI